ncbi:MAG: 4'-phosphopantetheinyl transferase family protein [Planctomycetota bacterium]
MTGTLLPPPKPGEVHVWQAAVGAAPVEADLALLVPAERARLSRLRPPAPRAEYVTGRALLRRILSRYLGVGSDAFAVAIGEHGKPSLAPPHDASGFTFSLSHTRGLSCLAVAYGAEVGVDVEVIRREVPHDKLADRFFSPDEVRQLEALAPAQQPAGFFRIWTRKEAYLKGRGDGITHGLANFDVVLGPDGAAGVAADRLDPGSPAQWRLAELALDREHVGAVALRHPDSIVVIQRSE